MTLHDLSWFCAGFASACIPGLCIFICAIRNAPTLREDDEIPHSWDSTTSPLVLPAERSTLRLVANEMGRAE